MRWQAHGGVAAERLSCDPALPGLLVSRHDRAALSVPHAADHRILLKTGAIRRAGQLPRRLLEVTMA